MLALDLKLPAAEAPPRKPLHTRDIETETEDMPFAVNYDRPEPAERVIWLTLAVFAIFLVVAII